MTRATGDGGELTLVLLGPTRGVPHSLLPPFLTVGPVAHEIWHGICYKKVGPMAQRLSEKLARLATRHGKGVASDGHPPSDGSSGHRPGRD